MKKFNNKNSKPKELNLHFQNMKSKRYIFLYFDLISVYLSRQFLFYFGINTYKCLLQFSKYLFLQLSVESKLQTDRIVLVYFVNFLLTSEQASFHFIQAISQSIG